VKLTIPWFGTIELRKETPEERHDRILHAQWDRWEKLAKKREEEKK
jgi:hypothetical protein